MNHSTTFFNKKIIGKQSIKKPLAVAIAVLLLGACASEPPEGSAAARNKLTNLQSDSQLATRAPVAIKQADDAVRAAEQPRKSDEKEQATGQHLVFIADHKVDTAQAQAQNRLAEDQRAGLSEQRETARLDARTLEADIAHNQVAALQQQIDAMNAKPTDRGLVVTLGDVLFDTGKSTLKSSAASNLNNVVAFLVQYEERTVIIEGNTDNVGNDLYNQGLSERRANAVGAYLARHGVAADRISAAGLGENSPVADNNTPAGRQENRRVEVIISNPVTR
jgi:outer membrane protein OmpA-like peptidoglycan-associated protein